MRFIRSIVFFLSFAIAAEALEQQVRVLVPKFHGDPALGNPVMTVVFLDLWRNLLRAAPVQGKAIGGMMMWSDKSLPDETHEAAENAINEVFPRCDMVVWGKAAYFGGGVVVQSFLSIPHERDPSGIHPEKWRVAVRVNRKELHAHVNLPQQRYEFTPFILKRELVEEFVTFGGIKIFDSPACLNSDGVIGSSEVTHEERNGEVSKITLSGSAKPHWIRLPLLSDRPSYVTDFVSGIIRVFRGDYKNADSIFTALTKAPQCPSNLKADAFLYKALAKDKRGLDGSGDASEALRINPYSMRSVQYYLAARCSAIGRSINAGRNRNDISKEIGALAKFADENHYLLPPDDETLALVRNLADEF